MFCRQSVLQTGTRTANLSVNGMPITEREFHYHIVTICFPALFFCCIVLYAFYKGRWKRRP